MNRPVSLDECWAPRFTSPAPPAGPSLQKAAVVAKDDQEAEAVQPRVAGYAAAASLRCGGVLSNEFVAVCGIAAVLTLVVIALIALHANTQKKLERLERIELLLMLMHK